MSNLRTDFLSVMTGTTVKRESKRGRAGEEGMIKTYKKKLRIVCVEQVVCIGSYTPTSSLQTWRRGERDVVHHNSDRGDDLP